MNRWDIALLGSIVVVAAAGIAITTSDLPSLANTSNFTPQAGQRAGNPVSQELNNFELVGQPSRSKLGQNSTASLPESVTDAVLEDAAQRSGMQASELQIVEAEQKTWSDGCLGLGGSDEFCTQALVPGWRVIVASEEKIYIYRTNESGSQIRLEKTKTCS